MKKKTRIIVLLISLIAFLLGVAFTALFMSPAVSLDFHTFSDNAVSYISFIISFIAFVFSMITYFSIDSVNSITAMDGNVLENENYSIAYEEVVDSFRKCKEKETFTEELLQCVAPQKQTISCMEYADELQKIIDYIIWFAYVDLGNEAVSKRCGELVDVIKKEQQRYSKLSNGINYMLNENVKLIEYVLLYQKIRNSRTEGVFSKLENIRGDMLRNPVSKIVYFDYLGLDYRRKAAAVLDGTVKETMKKAGLNEGREFQTDYMKTVQALTLKDEQREQFDCLSSRALDCFIKAEEYAADNVLWNGYIQYNKLRVDIMRYLVFKEKTREELIADIDNTIKARKNVQFLMNRGGSYLDKMFEDETGRVLELKENFMNC